MHLLKIFPQPGMFSPNPRPFALSLNVPCFLTISSPMLPAPESFPDSPSSWTPSSLNPQSAACSPLLKPASLLPPPPAREWVYLSNSESSRGIAGSLHTADPQHIISKEGHAGLYVILKGYSIISVS